MSESGTLNEISAGTLARLKRQEADDLAQEVLLRILDSAKPHTGRARFSTWVFRLTINLAHNHLKAAKLRKGGSLLACCA